MNFSPPPMQSGTKEQQLAAVYTYLFRMSDQLNLALQNLDAGNFSKSTREAIEAVSKPTVSKGDTNDEAYQNLRAMIIKTADTVNAQMVQIQATLKGNYVAKSDFGTYVQQLSAYLEANPEAITQYYKFASDLQTDLSKVDAAFSSYQAETEGYIRTGVVYYDDAVPVYGVAVGQNLTATTVDGETVIDRRDFRATFTAKKLSFWQDETEVAYVSNNMLYINEVQILNKLSLGNWQFSTGSGLNIKWVGG